MTQMNLSMKQKQTHGERTIENGLVVAKGESRWERDGLEVWD